MLIGNISVRIFVYVPPVEPIELIKIQFLWIIMLRIDNNFRFILNPHVVPGQEPTQRMHIQTPIFTLDHPTDITRTANTAPPTITFTFNLLSIDDHSTLLDPNEVEYQQTEHMDVVTPKLLKD